MDEIGLWTSAINPNMKIYLINVHIHYLNNAGYTVFEELFLKLQG